MRGHEKWKRCRPVGNQGRTRQQGFLSPEIKIEISNRHGVVKVHKLRPDAATGCAENRSNESRVFKLHSSELSAIGRSECEREKRRLLKRARLVGRKSIDTRRANHKSVGRW